MTQILLVSDQQSVGSSPGHDFHGIKQATKLTAVNWSIRVFIHTVRVHNFLKTTAENLE